MSLSKNQFEALIYQLVKKIKRVEGVKEYLSDLSTFSTPHDFYFGKFDHLHYCPRHGDDIDLDWLYDNGAEFAESKYHSFIDELLDDTKKLIEEVKLQRKPFLEYIEKIENL